MPAHGSAYWAQRSGTSSGQILRVTLGQGTPLLPEAGNCKVSGAGEPNGHWTEMWVLCDPRKWLPFVGLGFFVSVTDHLKCFYKVL